MRYGIPLLANRVAPRCTIAEALLLIDVAGGEVAQEVLLPTGGCTWNELVSMLVAERVETLVCGGISRQARHELQDRGIAVVDNVAATADAVLGALAADRLRPGFGFAAGEEAEMPAYRLVRRSPASPDTSTSTAGRSARTATDGEGDDRDHGAGIRSVPADCLGCRDHVCLRGGSCPLVPARLARPRRDVRRILDAALDITCEDERTLCRLSELVYFGLEMDYHHLGIAFCWDLLEPTRILVGVLRRFFAVTAVGCKIGGARLPDAAPEPTAASTTASRAAVACNPRAQARVLDDAGCDLNVMVGLCMGADCVFAEASRAPSSTLFVKDRSLANNPIGALYSDHYLKEALRASAPRG
jgi:uncharacterized metal-binding protein/predicted Fe-Mo cluster-binding NifX family protein